ncbi:MAG: SMC-Scp complex subunit ScpB [Planctomycetales bacterium]|nr:SMC-Scp complex subunit ScpB [Planctomycetales bacterium]
MKLSNSRLAPTAQLLHSCATRYLAPCRPRLSSIDASGNQGQHRVTRRWLACDKPSVIGELDGEELEEKLGRAEAVLFLSREPLTSRKLAQYANLADGTEARTLVRRLNERLDQFGRSFRVQEVAGGFQLTTRRKFANWLRRLDYVPGHERLSAPALETLAIIAYRQPVMRADIEAIRGVSCGEVVNQLMTRDLVRVGGRSSELGRPYLYNTTKRFLQVFGLRSLEELPRAEAFRRAQVQPPAAMLLGDAAARESESEVEEETDVSVAVELEQLKTVVEPTDMDQDRLDPNRVAQRELRMEDEDYDDEEEFEDEDEEFEDDEEYEDDDEEEEFDEEEYEEDEEYEEEEGDDEEDADDADDEEDDEELEDEEEYEEDDEEWEEVEGEEDEEEDDDGDDDWEDEDWEDDEEWEE